jgi:hypothetical protein
MAQRLSRRKLGRLRKEADTLARQRHKTPGMKRREATINAQFERDMRARDREPAPFTDPGE